MSWRALLLIVAAALLGWWVLGPRNSWRYKMTVEVQTPEGVRTGYAVREVKYQPGGGFWIAQGRPQWRARGEAVAIDLPGGRSLFALLIGNDRNVNYGARIADLALGERGQINGWPRPVQLYPSAPDRAVFRNIDPLPMMVTFANPTDPATVEAVDPRNLTKNFGSGNVLKKIIIEIVNESITDSIENRLPWLSAIGRKRGTLRPSPPALLKDAGPTDLLGPSAFKTGLYK